MSAAFNFGCVYFCEFGILPIKSHVICSKYLQQQWLHREAEASDLSVAEKNMKHYKKTKAITTKHVLQRCEERLFSFNKLTNHTN